MRPRPTIGVAATLLGGMAALVALMARGKLTLDLGWGRSVHPLGPIVLRVEAPRDLVFEHISAPYLRRTPRELRDHLQVIERGEDLVVAVHRTRLAGYTAETMEAVGFEPPERVRFRHLRGPVPHAVEEFILREAAEDVTELEYRGELGVDFWLLGWLAARLWVRPVWERVVEQSLEGIRERCELRSSARRRRQDRP